MKSVFLAAALALSSTPALAWFIEDTSKEDIGEIAVELRDNATGACWTNLKEVREYAEEKLRAKGYPSEGSFLPYTFQVSVSAFRVKEIDACIANISIEVFKLAIHNEVIGYHHIGGEGYLAINQVNVNREVIETAQKMIDDM